MTSYIEHLAQTTEIQKVLVKHDIVDVDGQLILPVGEVIDEDAADLLLRYKLKKPIDTCVELEHQFTAGDFYEIFNDFIHSDHHLVEIYEIRDLDQKFSQCIEHFCQYELLRQHLNVLAIQMPDVFEQSMFCAWIAASILASENHLQARLNEAFLAGITHDLGLLEVPPNILFKQGALSPEEWEILQSHPSHSAKTLKRLAEVPKVVIQAVLEHHENPDGTGYPKGKMEQQLSELGRVINMLDSVFAIYRKHFKPRGRSMRDLIPVVQMATLSRGGQSGAVLLSLMLKTQKTDHCTVPTELVPQLIDWVSGAAEQIIRFVDISNAFRKNIGTAHKDINLFALQSMARYIRSTLTSCGIINEAYLRWLAQVKEEQLEFAYRELEDVLLMLMEITHHMSRFNRLLTLYLGKTEKGAEAQVRELQRQLTSVSAPPIPEALQPYITL